MLTEPNYIIEQDQYPGLPEMALENPRQAKFYKELSVDLDGTLFRDPGNIEQKVELEPMPGAATITQRLHSEGYQIIISTCRPHYQRIYLEDQLKKNGIYHDYILFYTKPRSDIYIDNKGLHFTTWIGTYNQIKLREKEALGLEQPFNLYEKQLQKLKIQYLRKTFLPILEVGCGDGSVFEGTEYTVDGFDKSQTAINLCKTVANYRKCSTVIEDLEPINAYDLVALPGVLEHVEDPMGVLTEYREAKELYITVPNCLSFHRLVGMKMGTIREYSELSQKDHDIGHKHYFSPTTFLEIIRPFAEKNNFDIISTGTVGFKFASNLQCAEFSDIAVYLAAAADHTNLTGINRSYGAEIFCNLIKKGAV